ncbi:MULTISPECIES: MlaD family protein [Methylomonas]|uniref:Mammalian cell entry protein n=2 Tax=Methylomonas TaxID=416 RepID=A0A140E3P3_9GAMM|nr:MULTISPECIES: MlaD family protein [Methylomonas]AMK75017.1 mammalian cell entry protein [Methylomonas denitrificans]OAI02513.1 mammalian cell entry protein [Methylomonas methanica]TCV83169.1 paraquat-inducible protein B [Methylomonas methanica]
MSKQANPFAIGAFLVGALILLTAGVMIFGGSDFFKDKKRFVIFFDSALNGLNVGAPVKLQGVQIGNVKEISLVMDSATGRIFKPVVIEIDPALLQDLSVQQSGGHSKKQRMQDAQRLIDAGLKGRLETQSLLTGLLYVDLNFYSDKPVNLIKLDYKNLPELPSVPTTVDEIRNTADEILNRARQLPVEEMMKNLADTLSEMRSLLQSDDTKKSLAALAKSLQETQRLMATLNNQIGPLMSNANGVLSDTRTTLQDFNKELLPVLKAAEQSLTTATKVLEGSQHALNAVETMAAPDSQLGQALVEMRNASRSLKDLTESLERRPESLLYGK